MTDTMQLLQDYAASGDNVWLQHQLRKLKKEILQASLVENNLKLKDHYVIETIPNVVFEGTRKKCQEFSDTYLHGYSSVINYWDVSDDLDTEHTKATLAD